MYEGLEEDFATDPDLLAHLTISKEQLQVFFDTNYAPRSLVLAKLSVARVLQLWLPLRAPAAPHKKLTLLKDIKRKTALSSTSLMNISSLRKRILTHVSLLIGGVVAVHSFLNYIGL